MIVATPKLEEIKQRFANDDWDGIDVKWMIDEIESLISQARQLSSQIGTQAQTIAAYQQQRDEVLRTCVAASVFGSSLTVMEFADSLRNKLGDKS